MHTVYVLYSRVGRKYYIGRTADLERRIAQHNGEDAKGWTRRFQPWELRHAEEFTTRTEALRREYYLKSLKNPERLRQYISGWRSKHLQN
ncbi:MAG: GIY-YIG nuclease family protein [Candidatus Sungbacteria bacterium]|uniref:GIY-YIG nuclease family protein n=1 Tax=Candidatus Sungiibacteriota bacterium TaxID=2750080 RepID=A0A932YY45_9BACT|nr:GIY-YIG nuclease family protein [Candidatus Sungbacteria bacterium]